MFRMRTSLSYITIPSFGINDDKLSLAAKGLYAFLFSKGRTYEGSYEQLKLTTSSTLEEIQQVVQELVNYGYIEIKNNEFFLSMKAVENKAIITPVNNMPFLDVAPVEEKQKVQKPKRLSLFDKILNSVRKFTEDEDLRQILMDYFVARLNPAPDSRFATIGKIQLWQVNSMLKQLSELEGNKYDIVKYCLDNQYFKFFDIPERKTLDGVVSNSYTQEDIDDIQRRLNELKKETGEKVTF